MSMMPPPPPNTPAAAAIRNAAQRTAARLHALSATTSGASTAAGLGRVGATIIDGLIGATFSIPSFIALLAGPKEIDLCGSGFEEGQICEVPSGTSWVLFALLAIGGALAFLFLYCKKVGTTGQSWGHKAVGLRVVDAQSGGMIGAGPRARSLFRQNCVCSPVLPRILVATVGCAQADLSRQAGWHRRHPGLISEWRAASATVRGWISRPWPTI